MPLTPRPRPGLNQGPSAASSCPGAAPISGRPRRRALLRSRPFPLSQLPWLLLLLQASGKRTAARNQNYFYMRSLWEQSVWLAFGEITSLSPCLLLPRTAHSHYAGWRCCVAERRGVRRKDTNLFLLGGEVPPVPAEILFVSLFLVRQFALFPLPSTLSGPPFELGLAREKPGRRVARAWSRSRTTGPPPIFFYPPSSLPAIRRIITYQVEREREARALLGSIPLRPGVASW